MLTFTRLQETLPEESIRYPGAILTLDIANLTGTNLDFDSSIFEVYARLLQGLFDLQLKVNQERAQANPPLPPVDFIAKTLKTSTNGNPIYSFTTSFEISSNAILDAVIDPTTPSTTEEATP